MTDENIFLISDQFLHFRKDCIIYRSYTGCTELEKNTCSATVYYVTNDVTKYVSLIFIVISSIYM